MSRKSDIIAEGLSVVCVLVVMVAILCGLMKWVSVISSEVESTRLGQKIEYWLGDPNKTEGSP